MADNRVTAIFLACCAFALALTAGFLGGVAWSGNRKIGADRWGGRQ